MAADDLVVQGPRTSALRSHAADLVYCQTSNIRCTLVGNKIVDQSNVVWASPVGAAPNTSSFLTQHLASMDWAKTAARWDEKHLSFGIWCGLYQRFDSTCNNTSPAFNNWEWFLNGVSFQVLKSAVYVQKLVCLPSEHDVRWPPRKTSLKPLTKSLRPMPSLVPHLVTWPTTKEIFWHSWSFITRLRWRTLYDRILVELISSGGRST